MLVCPHCKEENPAKFRLCGYCGTPLAGAAAPRPSLEVRKTVTLLFCDLAGSTALAERIDAEALHEVKESWFRAMSAEIARHGGKTEKYVGDAVMAVFGLPRAREDDALRAVRAALGMRQALERLNRALEGGYGVRLVMRTGINTGVVVANEDPDADQKLATGDAINVTARLEQAAGGNEIVIGATTQRLVADEIDCEALAALQLKGKAEPLPAWRVVGPRRGGRPQARRGPLVGRADELAAVERVLGRVIAGEGPQLVSIVGDAGSGKFRIAGEVLARAGAGVRTLRGRCPAYGEGITFWPLREMLVEAAGIGFDDDPAAALARLAALCGDADVSQRLAAAAGFVAGSDPLHELYWAAGRFVRGLAAGGPLVLMVDDLHRAEPAFVDLLEHLLQADMPMPVLLLTLARTELLQQRPGWGTGERRHLVSLAPLAAPDAHRLAAQVMGVESLPDDVAGPVVAAANGNPLFIEQLLSMLKERQALRREGDTWVRTAAFDVGAVPPTIRAVLEARLGQLGTDERAVVGPAAVIGVEFPVPALEAIAPEPLRPAIAMHLQALTQREFVHPAVSPEPLPMYRFQNHLVRDTVYGSLLKRQRATLHVAVVRWGDAVTAERGRAMEFEEILGFHLEQACRCLAELGPLDAEGQALGADGSRRLAAAARRAAARGDMKAAAPLFRRAAALRPAAAPERLALLPELAEALVELGEFAEARALLDEADAGAAAAGDARTVAAARTMAMFVRLYGGESGADWGAGALAVAHAAIERFGASADHGLLAMAWRLVGLVHGVAGHFGQANEATVRYMHHARKAGNGRLVARSAMAFAIGALSGPTPVADAIAECNGVLEAGLADRQVKGVVMCVTAQLRAMNGDFAEARALYRQGRQLLRELGRGVSAASTGIDLARVELLAGDLALAEREVRADYQFLQQKGESYLLASMAATLALIVREAGRDDDALALLEAAEAAAADDDVDAQVLWRATRAPIEARRGRHEAAQALAREAVAMAQSSDAPVLQADSLRELAETLAQAGQGAEAGRLMADAAARYAAKGDVVSAARAAGRAAAWAAGVSIS